MKEKYKLDNERTDTELKDEILHSIKRHPELHMQNETYLTEEQWGKMEKFERDELVEKAKKKLMSEETKRCKKLEKCGINYS